MKCPVCNCNKTIKLLTFDDIRVKKCMNCSHEFSEHQDNINFEIYNEQYYTDEHENWFKHPNLTLFQKIKDYIQEFKSTESSVVDIGCGKGDFLFYLKNNNFSNLIGIDLSKNNDDDIIKFKQANIFDFEIKSKYDVVINFAVIEHLNNLNKFVEVMETFVQNNGLLIVMTLDSDSFLYKASKLLYRIGIHFPIKRFYSEHHVNHFNKKSLKSLLNKKGFEVLEHFNTNFPVKAIDISEGPFKQVILFFVKVIFFFTQKRYGMLQTIILKKIK